MNRTVSKSKDEKMLTSIERHDHVGLIIVNNPPVNALSQPLANEIIAALDSLETDSTVRVIVLTAVGRTFVAGADVRDFERMIAAGKCHLGAGLYEVTNRLERSPKPVVAALFGTVLGGGLELAMACHFRIAARKSFVGQPEVKLGLIPGAGGTQRLPRLCGIAKAAELCAFGEMITAEEAFELGIIDRLSDDELRSDAIEYALKVSNDGARPTRDRLEKITAEDQTKSQLTKIRQLAREKFQGAGASSLAVDAVEKSAELSFEDGLTIENDLFVQALSSAEAKTLIHLFFAERAVTKVAGITKKTPTKSISSVSFLGLTQPYAAILPFLIRNEIDIQLAYHNPPQRHCDIVFVEEIDETIRSTIELMDGPIVVSTLPMFAVDTFKASKLNSEKICGLKVTHDNGTAFAEIGIHSNSHPEAVATLLLLLKKLGIPFAVEQPNGKYASDRISPHRFDSSDLLIEAWQLVQEKVVERISDVDVIQVNCFKTPRHQANIGISVEQPS